MQLRTGKRDWRTIGWLAGALLLTGVHAPAQLRDGGIDPWNLGKGDWIFSMTDGTNKLGGHVTSVTNENSLMLFYKSQGIRYMIVKAATNDKLFNGCYAGPQFTSNLVNIAHANGILIFGYNRSYGSNIVAEVAISDYVFNQGADGFVWDAEAEWEALGANTWITNGPAQAWQLCATVRSNWPNKFLAHAPFPIISLHASFPYKEFGYWCDAVMPQIYHFSSTGIKGSPSAAINWSDVNWANWQNSLVGSSSVINGTTVFWTNSIKPITPLQDVYGPTVTGGVICEGTVGAYPDEDVMEFIDYSAADPNAQTAGGYKGVNFWRADLHGAAQWGNIKAGASGNFPGVVNNIVMDDARAAVVGAWTSVRVFGATATLPTYYGATGSDTNSFGTNYFSKGRGTGAAYVQFTPSVAVAGDYDVYQWHPYVTNASASVPHLINYNGGSTNVNANQQTNAGKWSLLGRFNFAAGTSGYIRVTDNFPEAGRVAIADGIKLVFISSTSAPVITNQPQDATVVAGQDAVFSVIADGAPPLKYQWRFKSVPIAGATNSGYTRFNAQSNDASEYRVVITNALGSITSAPAALTVNFSLTTSAGVGGAVSRNPNQPAYAPGTTVVLTASPDPGYDFSGWSGDAGGTNNPFDLVMGANATVTATFLSSQTDIILDNTNAGVLFINNWTLGTTAPGRYQADYQFAATVAGGNATATYRPGIGTPGYYDVFLWYPQGSNRATNAPWSVSYNGGNTNVAVDQTINGGGWHLIAGAVPLARGTNGYVRLSNDTGFSGKVVIADAVRFTFTGPLNRPAAITAQPTNLTVKIGSNATFTVTATGTPAPAFQWRFKNANISGATASSYTRSNAQPADGGDYSVIVTNIAGNTTSSNALLTVLLPAPAQFQSITPLSDGRMHLVISGEPGAGLWIDRAGDLPNWQLLTNLINTNGTVEFTDNAASNGGRGFYRARE